MVYNFNGEIFMEGQRSFISIPFNVWDECGLKGNLPVKVTIEDFVFECKLVPKCNGIYYIPITKNVLKEITQDKDLKISFEPISGLSRINNNSPYSLERPIRKIDSIELVKAPKKGLCGQSCVAMLSGLPINEIVDLMGSQSSMSKVIEALDYFGIAHADKMYYTLNQISTLPKCCIINTQNHYILFYDGKYYDESIGISEEFDIQNITGFLEIFI